MQLGEIIKMVLLQAGEDIEDAGDYREMLVAYINEGHARMAEKYGRERTATLYAQDGEIDVSGLRDMRSVKGVSRNETGQAVRYDARAGGRLFVGGEDGTAFDVRYTCEPRRLQKDTDEPETPESTHMAIADYATWRFFGNGNQSRQQRGAFYYQRFMMELDRMRPWAQRAGSGGQMHGLYDCT